MKKLLITLLLISGSAHADMERLFGYTQYPQEWCLAQNIYFEARGSSYADQVAVADVVLNRVESNRYPNDVCSVVQQGKQYSNGMMKKNQCQFSWWCDGKSDWPKDEDAWFNAQAIAWNMLHHDAFKGITEGALNYHADYVKPKWASKLQLVGQIGAHIFYRVK